jgi:hypothetical protein
VLPLVGPKAHRAALAQGETERVNISLGRAVSHDPLWECPSCGCNCTAAELQPVKVVDALGHYNAVLQRLGRRPRELVAAAGVGPGGVPVRRNSDVLDESCYWPRDTAAVAAAAGGAAAARRDLSAGPRGGGRLGPLMLILSYQ